MPRYVKPMKQWVIWGGEMPNGGVRLLASDSVMDTWYTVNVFDLDELKMQMMTTIEVQGNSFEECLATLFRKYREQGDTWQPPNKLSEPAKEIE